MSLEDLTQYASAQTDAINRLISMGRFTTGPISARWTEFKDSVWKKGLASLEKQELVERDDDPLEDYLISPDAIPPSALTATIPSTLPNVWGSSSQRILVRFDYQEAEETALSANGNNKDALLVAGHPGIGKTFFLIWLLIRRLALGLPTALQINQYCALLFHEGGVCQFTDLENKEAYSPLVSSGPGRIWALVDSNQDLVKPTGVFNTGGLFFVVQAAAPLLPRLQWLKAVNSQSFYMKRWTFSEILQARPFLGESAPYTERQLWHLHDTYGASTGAVALHAGDPTYYEAEVVRRAQSMPSSPESMKVALQSPYSDDRFDFLVVMEPDPISRENWVKKLNAQRVFNIFMDQHFSNDPRRMGIRLPPR